jgi:serine/threonine protein kinase
LQVFRGIDLETDRQVALKLLFHRATGAQPKESPDASREINALQALSDNNIVELLDVIHQASS